MTTHHLKIEQNYLENLIGGEKKAEVRYNDRDYQKGDILVYIYLHNGCEYRFKITHIHSGLGMADGYVVLSLKKLEEELK